MKVLSRKEALAEGLPKYFTGKSCNSGHEDGRWTSGGGCVTCCRISQARRRSYQKSYRDSHRAEIKKYKQDNLTKIREQNKANAKSWARSNPEKVAAQSAKKRAARISRTPSWLSKLDMALIESFYRKARLFSEYCGEPYHVDHKIPLQGKTVSGLHVPNNLRVIPAKDNMTKGNKYEESAVAL